MIVRCKRIIESGAEVTKSQNLTIGKDYVVLCAWKSEGYGAAYRVIGDSDEDQETPFIVMAANFDTMDMKIPSNWVMKSECGDLTVGPELWLRSEFWDNYFDYDQKAREEFKKERDIILTEYGK